MYALCTLDDCYINKKALTVSEGFVRPCTAFHTLRCIEAQGVSVYLCLQYARIHKLHGVCRCVYSATLYEQ